MDPVVSVLIAPTSPRFPCTCNAGWWRCVIAWPPVTQRGAPPLLLRARSSCIPLGETAVIAKQIDIIGVEKKRFSLRSHRQCPNTE